MHLSHHIEFGFPYCISILLSPSSLLSFSLSHTHTHSLLSITSH